MTTILRMPGAPGELTLPALLLRNAEDHGELPALSWRDGGRPGRHTLSWAEARRRVAELAAGYRSLGVRRGEIVLLMMGNRPEHWLSDLALVHLGAVPVTVYGTAAPGQIAGIARHSRARFAVLEGPRERERWEPLLDDPAARLEKLVIVDADGIEAAGDGVAGAGRHATYADLAGRGAERYAPAAFEDGWRQVAAGDTLTVVYTSGTTGEPKGVVISHRNVLLGAVALDQVVELPDHTAHLCYLPFAHIAERLLGLYLPVFRAGHVHLCADPATVAEAARELRPAEFFGVPRVWEKLTASVRAALARLPAERRAAVEAAGEQARAYLACQERGERPSAALAEAYAAAKAEVLGPVLAMAGFDRLVWTASAAAPMPPDVVRFWAGLGIVIMDAWGLTETAGVCTTNGPRAFRLGSVGRPIDGLEVRTAADGEIEVRGRTVCEGYLRADGSVEPATDAEGWFATGDLGRFDEDGFLWLTGRKKEMIVTSTGKNVSPALVENTLKEHPLIGQALVHGDGRSYLVALLVLDPEAASAWAARRGIGGTVRELAGHPEVRAEVERAVEAANSRLNRTEQVKKFSLLGEEWGPETGELTPSLKLRRQAILVKYGQILDVLYTM
ncbi:putative fatty acid--CoA ligase [Streptomyces sp. NBRC 110611]|uniref:AMP-dependent synthetase/ligase n=1 Tax=Streptomyces sp. NBRC 110611 TaxID=1621259 RepID=UPI000831217D|nr:AMP-dependent synthetase/ligase [Streptomyces sp. NBRC 110611]GAU65660.1 putative fatty acid--CoA ligase [Streptomyces sp. NBRC 110611]